MRREIEEIKERNAILTENNKNLTNENEKHDKQNSKLKEKS